MGTVNTVGKGYGSHLSAFTKSEHAGDEKDLEEKEEERSHRPVEQRKKRANVTRKGVNRVFFCYFKIAFSLLKSIVISEINI